MHAQANWHLSHYTIVRLYGFQLDGLFGLKDNFLPISNILISYTVSYLIYNPVDLKGGQHCTSSQQVR